MTCYNIVDHRNHTSDHRCDAVLETLVKQAAGAHATIGDVKFLTRTTVSKVILKAQSLTEDVCVCLYDPGSISKTEIKQTLKNS